MFYICTAKLNIVNFSLLFSSGYRLYFLSQNAGVDLLAMRLDIDVQVLPGIGTCKIKKIILQRKLFYRVIASNFTLIAQLRFYIEFFFLDFYF